MKIFPIQNDAACVLKWSWATYYMGIDQINMCHRTGAYHLDDRAFEDFDKHPQLIIDRERMANNEWPESSCSYCKNIEDAGGTSERQVITSNNSHVVPVEIQEAADGSIPERVTPRILEIYFKNTCNLSCAYCSPMFSSKVQAELKAHGPISERYKLDGNFQSVEKELYESRKKEFWNWMDKHSHKLSSFHILGGEPFYQEEFQECLDFFNGRQNPDTTIKVFSNLMHDTDKFQEKIDTISNMIKQKQIQGFHIVCSMDAWGKEQEFARYGIDLELWERNFNILVNNDFIELSVHSTICPLTLPTNWELTHRINTVYKKIKPTIVQSWNIIADPCFLSPVIFGDYMEEDFQKLVDEIRKDATHKYEINNLKVVEGFMHTVANSEPNPELVNEFLVYIEELSRRRNLDWRKTYPHLESIIDEIIYQR